MQRAEPTELCYRRAVQIHPTRACAELTWAGLVTVGVGLVAQVPAVVGYGAALLAGILVARSVTQIGVARVRAAGFEMLWAEPERVRRVTRSAHFDLFAEIRNRDSRATRYSKLRAVAAPDLEVRVEPEAAEVPANGKLRVRLAVHAPRVGRHGIHGLSLEVLGSPGLFEVPLTFANPQAVEVVPAPFATFLRSARGGRSRMSSPEGNSGRLAGDGVELRELREHRPGDPFRRIAWKASARRGKLLVTENEIEERDVVWVLLDASVECWGGAPGISPLDLALDEAATLVTRHLSRGDHVGLGLIASRQLTWLPPDRGPKHATALMEALAFDAACNDADRSAWEEAQVAHHVFDHLRPLDPSLTVRVRNSDVEELARYAAPWIQRAPLSPPVPRASSERERILRHYLAAYGIQSPPRDLTERAHTEARLARALLSLAREKHRPSLICIWARPPDPLASTALLGAIEKFPKRRTQIRWFFMTDAAALPAPTDRRARVVRDVLRLRLGLAQKIGERELARRGIRPIRRPEPA